MDGSKWPNQLMTVDQCLIQLLGHIDELVKFVVNQPLKLADLPTLDLKPSDQIS